MGEILGTNRGFELNNLTQWTALLGGTWSVITTSPYAGTYCANIASGDVSSAAQWISILRTDKAACTPGTKLYASAYHNHISGTDSSGVFSARDGTLAVNFYDSDVNYISGTLIKAWTISLSGTVSGWTKIGKIAVAPANTALVAIQLMYNILMTSGTCNLVERWDAFSINVPYTRRQVINWL